jgi:hypothetical protein
MRKPPEHPTFFVDVDLGTRFFHIIAQDPRFSTEFLGRHFAHATDDAVWIDFASTNGWIAVTHDKKIRRQHREMIARTSARIIILAGKSSLESQAQNFRSSFPQIERFVRSHSGPYTAKLRQPSLRDKQLKLNPTGHIEMWGDW